MQTLKENQLNYIVFPSSSFTAGVGSDYLIFLTPTLTNNELYDTYATASLEELNSRWRVVETFISTDIQGDLDKVYAKAGQTYELQLRYGNGGYSVWIDAYPEWKDAEGTWIQNGLAPGTVKANSVLISQDRVFISGSVDPTETLYITSNEDASFVIYQG